MTIINANLVEIEVQEQSLSIGNKLSKKYMVQVKYEKNRCNSVEIASILLTDSKPLIISSIDTGTVVVKQK